MLVDDTHIVSLLDYNLHQQGIQLTFLMLLMLIYID